MRNAPGRIETGPVKFGEDWTGLFIRGDNCLFYSQQLRLLQTLEVARHLAFPHVAVDDGYPSFVKETLESLIRLMDSAREGTSKEDLQQLKSFEECDQHLR